MQIYFNFSVSFRIFGYHFRDTDRFPLKKNGRIPEGNRPLERMPRSTGTLRSGIEAHVLFPFLRPALEVWVAVTVDALSGARGVVERVRFLGGFPA